MATGAMADISNHPPEQKWRSSKEIQYKASLIEEGKEKRSLTQKKEKKRKRMQFSLSISTQGTHVTITSLEACFFFPFQTEEKCKWRLNT